MLYVYIWCRGMVFTNDKYPFCFVFFCFSYMLLSRKEKTKPAERLLTYLPLCPYGLPCLEFRREGREEEKPKDEDKDKEEEGGGEGGGEGGEGERRIK